MDGGVTSGSTKSSSIRVPPIPGDRDRLQVLSTLVHGSTASQSLLVVGKVMQRNFKIVRGWQIEQSDWTDLPPN